MFSFMYSFSSFACFLIFLSTVGTASRTPSEYTRTISPRRSPEVINTLYTDHPKSLWNTPSIHISSLVRYSSGVSMYFVLISIRLLIILPPPRLPTRYHRSGRGDTKIPSHNHCICIVCLRPDSYRTGKSGRICKRYLDIPARRCRRKTTSTTTFQGCSF